MINKVWQETLLEKLSDTGDLGKESADYIRNHNVRIAFKKYSKSTGARWLLFQRITLNTLYYSFETKLDEPKLLSLFVHEVHHLKQGAIKAFSVYGELDAWQVEYRFYRKIRSAKLHPAIEEILTLPLNYDRDNLRHSAKLMQSAAGKGYRIDLYPLYPLHREILYWVMRRDPKS